MANITGLLTDHGFKGTGVVKVRRKDLDGGASAETGYITLGNATEFSIQPSMTTDKRLAAYSSSMRGQTLDTDTKIESTIVRLVCDTIGKQNLGIALAGTPADMTQTEALAQTKTFTSNTTLDRFLDIGTLAVPIKDITVTSVVVGSDTMVENEDYVVHGKSGQILFTSTGDIESGDTVVVTYSRHAITTGTGYSIDGSTLSNIKLEIVFEGEDLISGEYLTAVVYEMAVSPQEAVQFISPDTFQNMTLQGEAITPAGYSTPYVIRRWTHAELS